jgi:hypothetical protein
MPSLLVTLLTVFAKPLGALAINDQGSSLRIRSELSLGVSGLLPVPWTPR